MQNPKLIPSPLSVEQNSHRPIEIAEPSRPSKRRFIKVALFVLGMFARTLFARLWPRYGRRFDTLAKARLLRAFMEEMGGLWIKAGQIIALRRDIFSEQFCSEIARLQDRVRGFPYSYAKKQIEEALGQPIDAVFSEFDEKPLAAASIGQVHAARLRSTGVEVVVKVRRPNVAESFAADFRFLYIFVSILDSGLI
jgi:ubiquinone biosynthesis protein